MSQRQARLVFSVGRKTIGVRVSPRRSLTLTVMFWFHPRNVDQSIHRQARDTQSSLSGLREGSEKRSTYSAPFHFLASPEETAHRCKPTERMYANSHSDASWYRNKPAFSQRELTVALRWTTRPSRPSAPTVAVKHLPAYNACLFRSSRSRASGRALNGTGRLWSQDLSRTQSAAQAMR
jgi:hypothetical protein